MRVVLAFIAGLLLLTQITTAQDATPVWVAAVPIPRGTILTNDALYGENALFMQVDFPIPPQNAIFDLSQVEGSVIRSDMVTRAPLLLTNVVNDFSQAASIGSEPPLFIDFGWRGVPISRLNATFPDNLVIGECVSVMGIIVFDADNQTELQVALVATVVDVSPLLVAADIENALVMVWAQDNNVALQIERCATSFWAPAARSMNRAMAQE